MLNTTSVSQLTGETLAHFGVNLADIPDEKLSPRLMSAKEGKSIEIPCGMGGWISLVKTDNPGVYIRRNYDEGTLLNEAEVTEGDLDYLKRPMMDEGFQAVLETGELASFSPTRDVVKCPHCGDVQTKVNASVWERCVWVEEKGWSRFQKVTPDEAARHRPERKFPGL